MAPSIIVPRAARSTRILRPHQRPVGVLHRDFRDKDYPRNCMLITYSLAIQLFVMRWFYLTVEELEEMRSPANCTLTVLELDETGDEYLLLTPLARNPEASSFVVPSTCPSRTRQNKPVYKFH